MKFLKTLSLLLVLLIITPSYAQKIQVEFGTETNIDNLLTNKKQSSVIKWVNVNTDANTWTMTKDELKCSGHPIGVMRSEKQYENFIMHVEWKHMEAGGNSGVFVWSSAVPDEKDRLPNGVEVQMLDLEWVKLNTKEGETPPPIAYVHGELFGVGGVETVPDNPRGTRSKSIENLCRPRGEWNTYDVVCVDGVIKLSVNGKFVNGISKSTQKIGYLCLESEGAEIRFRNFSITALPPGVTSAGQPAR
ncbi:MAG: DUF1080 domain-containing protein [Chryseolinea sp.]